MKPIVCLEGGKVASKGVARGEKSALAKLTEVTTEYFKNKDINSFIFCVGYTDEEGKPLANRIMTDVKTEYLSAEFLGNFQIGATIGSHTGKGTFGIAFAKR